MKTLLFDTETTGLVGPGLIAPEFQPRIIEFFGVIIEDDGSVVEELEFLANPGQPLEPKITQITGLRDEDVKFAAPFEKHASKVQEFFNSADQCVGHNLAFDLSMVNIEFERLGRTFRWPKILICTVAETEHIAGYRLSLTALHEYLFEQPFSGAHRARQDVEALVKCWTELKARELV